jgi:hypothetical protein
LERVKVLEAGRCQQVGALSLYGMRRLVWRKASGKPFPHQFFALFGGECAILVHVNRRAALAASKIRSSTSRNG